MVRETPNSYLGYGGIILIVIGTYILNLDSSNKSFLGPFKALFRSIGAKCALGAAFIMSIMANMFKIGILNSNVVFYIVLVNLMISIFFIPYIIKKLDKIVFQIKSRLKEVVILGIAKTIMEISAGFALVYAIVPYVISLKRSSILFGMGYSYFMFKEKHIKGRLLGAVVMLSGAVMIILS